jgi:hypothetical protein
VYDSGGKAVESEPVEIVGDELDELLFQEGVDVVCTGLEGVTVGDVTGPVGVPLGEVTFEDVSGPVDDGLDDTALEEERRDEVALVREDAEIELVVRLAEVTGVEVGVVVIDEEFVYLVDERRLVELVLDLRRLEMLTRLVGRVPVEDGRVVVKLEPRLVEDSVSVVENKV